MPAELGGAAVRFPPAPPQESQQNERRPVCARVPEILGGVRGEGDEPTKGADTKLFLDFWCPFCNPKSQCPVERILGG